MREARDSDFFVEVDAVGKFRFGRRTFADRAKIRAEFIGYTQDVGEGDPELTAYASIMAAHKVLCVEAPEGWADMDNLDLTVNSEEKVFELYAALRDVEERFRQGAIKVGKTAGA